MEALNIRPVTDLRNKFNEIESDIKAGPVFFTKNGYGASVMLSRPLSIRWRRFCPRPTVWLRVIPAGLRRMRSTGV